ncbi:FkbM family methyltransferase [Roseicyclus persicicus]|uniref:FkbM family methyltransferase n=1 Tax=Roseicyclus persicicus TaxID=2650661 RepID=A0A7X6GX42_9RHOB|nr:FkbM family methyltransferase [Roseibacterium persicicum]NKX44016.1 FkbM family methyltransferase [Roseibacterium persicicum]
MERWLGLARSLVIYHNPATVRAWRRFYGQILRPGDLVIDVGAHVGTRTRAMRRAGARVVALEPQALFARYLRLTLPRDIVLIEAAAGGAETVARMAVSSRHPTVSSLQAAFVDAAPAAPGFGHVRWDRTEEVRMVTLDGLIARHGVPAYVKIDVEGFEIEVLSGLSRPVPMLSVEYLPGFASLTTRVIARLEELGPYRFNPVVGERSGFLWPDWRDGAAAREWLAGLPADAASGDLFARLP